MPVVFKTGTYSVPAHQQDQVKRFLKENIDSDLDVKAAALHQDNDLVAEVIKGWHADKEGDHLTVRVMKKGKKAYTAHIYRNGQITGFT
jgi:hypothetical protein